MPLPFIPILLGGLVVSALGIGGKKSYDGIRAMREARRTGEAAETRHREHVRRLEAARRRLGERFSEHDGHNREVAARVFGRLVTFLERLEQTVRVAALESMGSLGVSRESVRQFAAQYLEVGGTVSGAVAAVLTGAGSSTLATGAVTMFATTAGGAAIPGLSGAALNSALLAWLGGGAITAGGWGMAAGSVVLGGVAIGPAVLVGGFVLAHQGEKALTRATEYSAQVDVAVARLSAATALLGQAEQRIDELRGLITSLDQRASNALDRLEALDRFDLSNDGHVAQLATSMQLGKALSDLMRARVLTDDGYLDGDTTDLLARLTRENLA